MSCVQIEKGRCKVLSISFTKMERRPCFKWKCTSKETHRTVQLLNLSLVILLNPHLNADVRSAPEEYDLMKKTLPYPCLLTSYCLLTSRLMKEPPSISAYLSIATLLLVVPPVFEMLQFSLVAQNQLFYGFKNTPLESNLMDSLQKAEERKT